MLCCCVKQRHKPQPVIVDNASEPILNLNPSGKHPEPLVQPHEAETLQANYDDTARILTSSRRLSELAAGLPFVDASVSNTPIAPRRYPARMATKYVVDVAPSPPRTLSNNQNQYLARILAKSGRPGEDKTRLLDRNGFTDDSEAKFLSEKDSSSKVPDQNGPNQNGNAQAYDAMLRNSVKMCNQLQSDLDGYIKTISPPPANAETVKF